ncbi:MAG TPA: protein kinase [Polyangiaceae bacterium]|nr:protein kinase [Polyangiaceae bacterium]
MSLAPPSPSLMPGHRLDRYELLALIAEGGMGQVWLARLVGKHGFEKLVAVKTLLPKYAADLKFQQMFLDEARIASGIEHANVAQILDLGEQNDVLYLVMELVDGEALSKLTRVLTKAKIEFPISLGLRIIADTCAGIHVAHELRGPDGHELGIVHRDISPQNILITTTGVAKLIDFGIAKARDRFAGETSEGILKGKIHYMAPEQALGKKMDRRADVFALGAILYLLFAGRPAYDGESQLEILHLLTSGRPPLPLPASVPRPVSDVIRKALAPAPEARYQTALELQRAINKVMGECKLMADTSDVAAFAATHLAARTQKRRQAIELALRAAAERAAVNATLLSPTSTKSSPGTKTNMPLGAVTPGPASTTDVVVLPGQRAEHIEVGRVPSVSEVEAVAMRSDGISQTMASSRPKRRGFGRVALVGAAAAVIALVIGLVATRGPRDTGKNAPVANAGPASTKASAPAPDPSTAPAPKADRPQTTASTGNVPDAAAPAEPVVVARPNGPSGRPVTHHVTPAATAAKTSQPAPTQTQTQTHSNVPDFGY